MAITYFGYNVDASTGQGGGFHRKMYWNNPATIEYTCPGTGKQLIKALEGRIAPGQDGVCRVFVYTSAGVKVCECPGSYLANQTGWYGVANDATAISPANTELDGGTKYILAFVMDDALGYIKGQTLADGMIYTDILMHYPVNTLPTTGLNNFSWEPCIRCGVEPVADPAPTITSLDVVSGPAAGGTAVDITGTGFTATPTVTFGGEDATDVVRVSATHVTCVTPAHAAGAVDVVLTNPDEQDVTAAGAYTYVAAPTITSLDKTSGTAAGGTAVSITGTGFVATPGVKFGGTAATSVTRVSATNVTCVTPAHAVGAVDVVLTNPDTQTATKANGFTYVPAEVPFPTPDTYRKLHQSIA